MSSKEKTKKDTQVYRRYLSEGLERHDKIPPSTADAVMEWVVYRTPPGGFVKAVLCNDLAEAVGRADSGNLRALPDTVKFLYNWVPSACWGSLENYNKWVVSPNGLPQSSEGE